MVSVDSNLWRWLYKVSAGVECIKVMMKPPNCRGATGEFQWGIIYAPDFGYYGIYNNLYMLKVGISVK